MFLLGISDTLLGMTVRAFTIGSTVSTVVSAAIWLLIVFFLDPLQAGVVGYILFFLSLFLLVASLAGLIGFGVRRAVRSDQLSAYSVRSAVRQGIMLGAFVCLLLLLVRLRLYQWWVALILTVFFVSGELIFLSYDASHQRRARTTEK